MTQTMAPNPAAAAEVCRSARRATKTAIESYLDSSRCRCDDCAALLTSKSPLDGFACADGRFMYHGAPPKELGGGPGVRMRAQDATALWSTVHAKGQRPGQFAPARYLVRARIPDFWDHIGLLPTGRAEGGWHWPNRPGTIVETWAHAVELRLLEEWGWGFDIVEGVRFTPSSPLRGFQTAIDRMLTYVTTLVIDGRPISPRRRQVVEAAIRQMFRVTIGAMAR